MVARSSWPTGIVVSSLADSSSGASDRPRLPAAAAARPATVPDGWVASVMAERGVPVSAERASTNALVLKGPLRLTTYETT